MYEKIVLWHSLISELSGAISCGHVKEKVGTEKDIISNHSEKSLVREESRLKLNCLREHLYR